MAHGYQGGKRMAYSDEGYQYETGRHGGSMAYSDTTAYSGGRTIVAYTNSDDRHNAGRHGGRMVYADDRYDSSRHGGRMAYADERYDSGRHGGRMVYSDADNYDYDGRRRPAAMYDNDNRYGAATDVYSMDMDMEYAKKRADGEHGYYRRERTGDRRRPAVYTEKSATGYGARAVYSDEHMRGAGGQEGYCWRWETERMGDVRALAGGTVYSDEYSTVAGGQQKREDGAHTQRRREMEEAMAAMVLAAGAGGFACNEQGEQHDASYYNKREKHHRRREILGHLGAVAAAAFAMHEKHKARKVEPEDAQAHIIKEAMATAVATGSDDWAIHEFHRKKEISKQHGHKQDKC